MPKDMADTVLSIIEGHCWKHVVQESEGRDGVVGFNAGRNAALGEVADLIRQLRLIYKITRPKD